jgi:competence protein ComEA
LFGVAVFAAVGLLVIRGLLPLQESPVLSPAPARDLQISLGSGFAEPGVRQFSDGTTVADAMELTGSAVPGDGSPHPAVAKTQLVTGMALEAAGIAGDLKAGWMPARQRLALGIRLHPDRMTVEDWEMLPGIGTKLAVEIEKDRQINGDFGSFDALERVKGIGPAKLNKLRSYFVDDVK